MKGFRERERERKRAREGVLGCVMSFGGEEDRRWSCGKSGAVNLQKVSSIVEPCLSQSPIKVVITVRISSTYFWTIIHFLFLILHFLCIIELTCAFRNINI